MIWFLVLGSIFNLLSIIFYMIPHRFINTRKWLFAYGSFWLVIIAFTYSTFSLVHDNTEDAIKQGLFYGFIVILIFFFSTIFGVAGRLYLLRLENRGETVDSRFFHATMFMIFLFVTPILLRILQFMTALIQFYR